MSSEYCENLKKIELHAHLNGSLSVKTIGRLGTYVFYFAPQVARYNVLLSLLSINFNQNYSSFA